MAETITTAMAQPFYLATSYTASVTDSAGTNTRTFNPSGTNYYRTFLATTSGTGASEASPKEFLAYCASILVASRWSVTMTSAGLVKITHLGTGNGSITWTSTLIRNLLGFTGNIGPLAQNASSTATNQPTHFLRIFARTNDTGWTGEFGGIAGAELPDGSVDVLNDGYQKIRRSYSLRMHPRTPTEATTLSSNATPMWPLDASTSRWLTPSAVPTTAPNTTAMVWSVHEFMATAMGSRIAITHGDFQTLVAGSSSSYDTCYLAPKTAEAKLNYSTPNWKARVDRPGVEVLLYGRESIA